MPKVSEFREKREWTPFYDQLKSENDRACAIIGCTMIDNSLSNIIAGVMIDDEKAVDGILSNLNMRRKIELAYCLGVIGPKQRDDISNISSIRNFFAHHLHDVSFENNEIKLLCEKLKWYYETWYPNGVEKSPRKYFEMAVAVLIQNLVIQGISDES